MAPRPVDVFSFVAEFGIEGLPFTQVFTRHSSKVCVHSLTRSAPKIIRAAAASSAASALRADGPRLLDVPAPQEPDAPAEDDHEAATALALDAEEGGGCDVEDEDAVMVIEAQDELLADGSLGARDESAAADEDAEADEAEGDKVGEPFLPNEVLSPDVISAGFRLWRAEIALSLNCLRDHAESSSEGPLAVGAHGDMSLA